MPPSPCTRASTAAAAGRLPARACRCPSVSAAAAPCDRSRHTEHGLLRGGAGPRDGGVFKSTDGASTWVSTGLQAPRYVYALVIDPATPSTVYAGTEPGGVFKSTDGGGTWISANTGLPDSYRGVFALAIDPAMPSTLYAGLYSGVFKSTDGGEHLDDLPARVCPTAASSRSPSIPITPSTLYAGTLGGVFKSTDGGRHLEARQHGHAPRRQRSPSIPPRRARSTPWASAATSSAGSIAACTRARTAARPGCDRPGGRSALRGRRSLSGSKSAMTATSSTATAATRTARATGCGNGVVTAGEECDDGNRRPCDGCSRTCQIETGFCGDGVLYADCEHATTATRRTPTPVGATADPTSAATAL